MLARFAVSFSFNSVLGYHICITETGRESTQTKIGRLIQVYAVSFPKKMVNGISGVWGGDERSISEQAAIVGGVS